MPARAARPAAEREHRAVGGATRLDGVRLRLRELAGLHGGGEPRVLGGRERGGQLRGADAEALGRIREEGLLFGLAIGRRRGGYGGRAAGEYGQGGGTGNEFLPGHGLSIGALAEERLGMPS